MERQERRAKQRVIIQLPIVITDALTGGEIHGVTRDVSANGVFFHTKHWSIEISTPIEFKVTLPAEVTGKESAGMMCKGTVIRLEEAPQGRTGVAARIESSKFG